MLRFVCIEITEEIKQLQQILRGKNKNSCAEKHNILYSQHISKYCSFFLKGIQLRKACESAHELSIGAQKKFPVLLCLCLLNGYLWEIDCSVLSASAEQMNRSANLFACGYQGAYM